MSNLATAYQGVLTEAMGSWYRPTTPWSASDELANASLRTAALNRADTPPLKVTIVAHRPPPPDPILHAIRQASELVRLPRGWNSYDAEPVSSEAVRDAIAFLVDAASSIPNVVAPAVVPTVRGGLQLEWHRQGIDLEIEFDPNDSPSWYAEDRRTEKTIEATLLDEDVALLQWLGRASG